MRTPLYLPSYLIRDAELYAPGHKGSDAVEWILSDYPRLVGDLRQLRRRLDGFDRESADFDQRLEQLQEACRRILDL